MLYARDSAYLGWASPLRSSGLGLELTRFVYILETTEEDVPMARKTYTPELKAHMIALVRQGLSPFDAALD